MPARPQKKSGCLSVFFPFLNPSQPVQPVKIPPQQAQPPTQTPPVPARLPYRLRDDFLSRAEHSFLLVLRAAIADSAVIQAKVGLGDLFYVKSGDFGLRQTYKNKINRKHVDFLLCDSKTMNPIAGIELDDASHQREDRQERDEFVDMVFHDAGLPLIHIPVQREYNTREIAAKIIPFLRAKESPTPVPQSIPSSIQAVSVPDCPKCGIPMVLRTVAKGEYKGRQFYGCKNYPQCREVKPVPVPIAKPAEVTKTSSPN